MFDIIIMNLNRKILVALALTITIGATAQNEVKTFEIEGKIGATYPTQKYFGDRRVGASLGLESRWNLRQLPIDVGAEIYYGSALRRYQGEDQSNRIFSLSAVGHYNFMRGSRLSPFVGLGIGTGSCDVVEGFKDNEGGTVVVSPRVGVELFHHLRLTVDARFARKGYNTVGITVGGVIGGCRK